MDERAASNRTIRANAGRDLGVLDPEFLRPRYGWSEVYSRSDQSPERRPAGCGDGKAEKITSGYVHKTSLRISDLGERKRI
jgi:hypothetical protein